MDSKKGKTKQKASIKRTKKKMQAQPHEKKHPETSPSTNPETSIKKQDDKLPLKKKKENRDIYLVSGIFLVFAIFIAIIVIPNLDFSGQDEESTGPSDTLNYNGYIFEKYGNIWKADIVITRSTDQSGTPYTFWFHYPPDQVEHIDTIRTTKNKTVSPELFLSARKIYITFDPDADPEDKGRIALAGFELAKVASLVYGKEVKSAITKNDSIEGVEIITCDDVTTLEKVIYLKVGNTTGIYNTKGCIVVEGETSTELLKASERLTYEMLKIIV